MRKPSENPGAFALSLALLLSACVRPPGESTEGEAASEAEAKPEIDPQGLITGERMPARFDDSAIRHGAPDGAKVTIVEYVDFECKYCKKLADTVDHIAAQHPDDIRVVFKQFPLLGHPRAMPAGAAALAAAAQGKGEPYRARLFKYRTQLSDAELDAHAEAVGVPDMDRFRRDRSSPELLAQLEREREQGARVGVRSPPYAFVNGRPITSPPSLEEFTAIVDEELALAERLLAAGAKRTELYDLYLRYAEAQLGPPEPAPAPEAAPTTRNPEAGEYYAVFVDGSATLGEADALVTVIAFADLTRTSPKQIHDALTGLRERAPDVRVVFRHVVPPQASQQELARVALIAHAHDKFWPWLAALAEGEGRSEAAQTAAAKVGLSEAQLRERDSAALTAKLARDAATAGMLGLDRVPGYFVNGRYMGLDTTLDDMLVAVGEERERAEAFRRERPDSEDPYFEQLRVHPTNVADLEPPPADHFRRDVELDGLPVRGDPEAAQVHIVECADFDCAACASGSSTLTKLEEEFGARIAVYFRNYPLAIHPTADAAHRAAIAAGEQGKFWQMHDFLFANEDRRALEDFVSVADQLELDIARFEKDFESAATKRHVAADYDACRELGVRGAPGYLVNGRLVSGALPLELFRQVVAEELDGGFEAARAP